MSAFVVVLLVGLWAAILVPGTLRGRHHSPASSVDSFARSMSILATDLGRTGPPELGIPHGGAGGPTHGPPRGEQRWAEPWTASIDGRRRTLERRQTILKGLGSALGVSTVPAVALGGVFALLWVVLAAGLVTYLALLLRLRLLRGQTRRTVRQLPMKAGPAPSSLPLAAGEQG